MRAAWVKVLLGLAFAVLGVWVVTLAIDMVGIFGEGMGVDERSRAIYASAHRAVHLFGTASAVTITLFFMGRHRVLAWLALAAIILCGGYGVVNMVGFTTTNRLSVSEARGTANAAQWTKYENARADLEKQIKWLEGQVVDAAPYEKRRMLKEIDAKRRELSAVAPPVFSASQVLADPQATWFSRVTNFSAQAWQLLLPVPVAFLLFAAEVLSFVFAAHLFMTGLAELLAWPMATKKVSGSGDGGGGGKKLEPEKKEDKPAPAAAAAPAALRIVTSGPAARQPLDAFLQEQLARGRKFDSQRQISKQSGWSEGHVSKALKKLSQQGKLSRNQRDGKSKTVSRQRMGDGGSRHAHAY